jgi:hypothetical protein
MTLCATMLRGYLRHTGEDDNDDDMGLRTAGHFKLPTANNWIARSEHAVQLRNTPHASLMHDLK